MKISPKIVGMILSLITIGILFIPAITMYEAEKQTENRVLTLQGLYADGTIIHIRNINTVEVETQFNNEIVIGSSSNNDSYIYADNNLVKELYYGNWLTYIGNGTYQVNYNKNEPPFTITALEWNLGIPININGSTLAKFDFVKITMTGGDFPHPLWFKYWIYPTIPTGERLAYGLDNNVDTHIKLYTLTRNEILSFETWINLFGYPEPDIYIQFQSVPYNPDSKDFGDGNFTFKIEGFDFIENHKVFWNEEQLLYLSLGASIAIMTIATAFTTNIIDIKAEKGKGK